MSESTVLAREDCVLLQLTQEDYDDFFPMVPPELNDAVDAVQRQLDEQRLLTKHKLDTDGIHPFSTSDQTLLDDMGPGILNLIDLGMQTFL